MPSTDSLDPTQPSVLIVDDSPTFRMGLRLLLHKKDRTLQLVVAASGEEALELAAHHHLDAAVVDLVMPGIDGIETCHRLRGLLSDELPILMLTGSDDLQARLRGRTARVTEFLAKTSDFNEIVSAVLDFLQRNSPRRSATKQRVADATPAGAAPLFFELVAASGLSHILAESTMLRACEVAGVDVSSMTSRDLARALPHIARTLRIFLPRAEYAGRIDAVTALVARDQRKVRST
jgi:CheY-like chemotaxis protein